VLGFDYPRRVIWFAPPFQATGDYESDLEYRESLQRFVRDLWARSERGEASGNVRAEVEPHGAALLKLTPTR